MPVLNALGSVLSLAYPLLILLGLRVLRLPLVTVATTVLIVSALLYLVKRTFRERIPALVMGGSAFLVLMTGDEALLRFSPALLSFLFSLLFLTSIHGGDCLIYSFTLLMYREIDYASYNSNVRRYCKRLTVVWGVFLAFNGLCALYLVFQPSIDLWALYAGVVQYLLMGLLFTGEFVVRLFVDRRNTREIAFPDLRANSREPDRVIAYSGRYEDGRHKLWKDYLEETGKMREHLIKSDIVVILCDDFWNFLVTLTAAMQLGIEAVLSPNQSRGFLAEALSGRNASVVDDDCYQEALGSSSPAKPGFPPVSPEAKVTMYTSGSTGRPKAITHTIAQLSSDNGTLHGHWSKAFRWRTVVSTVSPCHIFGLLYAVISPFRCGIPVRRERVEFPGEFSSLGSGKLLVITSPQYLKQAAESLDSLKLRDPRLVTSGGALSPQVAKRAKEVFGSWPIEVYGSTETGGIAWRDSGKDGDWTLSPGVEVSMGEDGCLLVSSGYAGEPFLTSDLAEFTGTSFRLLGRKDSVVKLAEKRIDLQEVESRLIATGLCREASALVLQGSYRDYLGAVLVPSPELAGMEDKARIKLLREQLSDFLEPVAVPRRWRFVENIPRNSMGKIQKEELRLLFRGNTDERL